MTAREQFEGSGDYITATPNPFDLNSDHSTEFRARFGAPVLSPAYPGLPKVIKQIPDDGQSHRVRIARKDGRVSYFIDGGEVFP